MPNLQTLQSDRIVSSATNEKYNIPSGRILMESPRIGAILRQKGVKPQDLDDARQEVFLRILESLPELRNPAAFPQWVYRVTQHVARKYRRGAVFETLPDDILDRPPALSAAEEYDLATAISRLPRERAKFVDWVYKQGYSYTEAAEMAGCSRNRVKKQLRKSILQLRRNLIAPLQATLFVKDFHSDKRLPCARVPSGRYSVGVDLANRTDINLCLKTVFYIDGTTVQATSMQLPEGGSAGRILQPDWQAFVGEHLFKLTIVIDGVTQKQESIVVTAV